MPGQETQSGKMVLFHTHFTSNQILVSDVVEAATLAAAPYLASGDAMGNLEIALVEAINNVIEHAYAYDPTGPIELKVTVDPAGLLVELFDRGAEMPGQKLPAAGKSDLSVATCELPEGGFGWFLIHELVQDLTYCRDGLDNRLRFRLPIHQP